MCLDPPQSREEAKMNPPPSSAPVFMEEVNDPAFFWNRVGKGARRTCMRAKKYSTACKVSSIDRI